LFSLETSDEIPCHKCSQCQSAARFRTTAAARYKKVPQEACGRQGHKYHLADYYGRALRDIERQGYLVSFSVYLFVRNRFCHGLGKAPSSKGCLYIYSSTISVASGQELSVLSMCKHPCLSPSSLRSLSFPRPLRNFIGIRRTLPGIGVNTNRD